MKKGILFTFLMLSLSVASFAQLVITEIMYNPPGADSIEYVEIYNNGGSTVNVAGYQMISRFVNLTLPSANVNPGEYLVISRTASVTENTFGISNTIEWLNGSLTNTTDTLVLKNTSGVTVDSVQYKDSSPWPQSADNAGSSLVLCDVDSDNTDGANWDGASTPSGAVVNGIELLANPGTASLCSDDPILGFVEGGATVLEDDGILMIPVAISDGNGNQTQANISIRTAESTALASSDFTLIDDFVVFQAGLQRDTQIVSLQLTNDMTPEKIERLVLEITDPTNNASIDGSGDTYGLTIIDDEAPVSGNLIITGIIDAQPLSNSFGIRAVELYALDDVPSLSDYAVGSANNGGGGGLIETTLPAGSLSKGDCYYIAQDEVKFRDFFGFEADFIDGRSLSINGDDAYELFENGVVVDVFGDQNVDGSLEPWEYTDGWAYRKNGTGPDGDTFVLDNWTYSGINALDLEVTNDAAAIPFPSCSYSEQMGGITNAVNDVIVIDINESIDIDILKNDFFDNGIAMISITSNANNGTATTSADSTINYMPGMDYCGPDEFEYALCDTLGFCDTAKVIISINCPIPLYTVDLVTADSDVNFVPDSINRTCELRGVVYGVDNRAGDGVQFTLIDPTGGIGVFKGAEVNYTVTEGDSIHIIGRITQFSGLTQIDPSLVTFISSNNALQTPTIVTELDESTESEFIRIQGLSIVDVTEWDTTSTTGFNVNVTNGTTTFTMRVDDSVDLSKMGVPQSPFDLIGIGGQFSSSTPADDRYQIAPRYMEDVLTSVSVAELWDLPLRLFPNPATHTLNIQAAEQADQIRIYNLLGQEVLQINQPAAQPAIDVKSLPVGAYILTYSKGQLQAAQKFMKAFEQ